VRTEVSMMEMSMKVNVEVNGDYCLLGTDAVV
jgi:hypothetical protein